MSQITDEVKKQVDQWVSKNKRNQYGDPDGTHYAGGSPLFDERSAKQKDRYEYILNKYPDAGSGPDAAGTGKNK